MNFAELFPLWIFEYKCFTDNNFGPRDLKILEISCAELIPHFLFPFLFLFSFIAFLLYFYYRDSHVLFPTDYVGLSYDAVLNNFVIVLEDLIKLEV